MVKRICVAISLLVLVGCASMARTSENAITTLTWIKNVTDVVFEVGCTSGTFTEATCTMYAGTANVAQIAINNSRIALNNYKETGSALNAELLGSATKDLMPLILQFDQIYRNPSCAASVAVIP